MDSVSRQLLLSSGVYGDPYFANVSLLLHFDGANGSTTFTDSSPTPKTVTALGGAAISTAQSKFGGASGYFDGNGDYLSVPHSSSLSLISGNFTIEARIYISSLSATGFVLIGKDGVFGTSYPQYRIMVPSSAKLTAFLGNGNGVSPVGTTYTGTTTISTGAWHHIAIVKSGSTLIGFLDGGIEFSAAAATMYEGSKPLLIGYEKDQPSSFFMHGYIDELRITKGVARYTTAFTPPTAPFPNS